MRFDLVAFLGGLTVGAAAAALYGATRSTKLGWSGGGPGGSFGGSPSGSGGSSFSGGGGGVSYAPGGTGVYAGPSGPFGGGFMTPSEGEGESGPIVSVPPIIHDGDGSGIFGGSFFGVNVAPWFWPLNVLPTLMPRNEEIICKKIPGDPDEAVVCKRRYPVQAVAWGPPAGWL